MNRAEEIGKVSRMEDSTRKIGITALICIVVALGMSLLDVRASIKTPQDAYAHGINKVYQLIADSGTIGGTGFVVSHKGTLKLVSNAHVCVNGGGSFTAHSANAPLKTPHFKAVMESIDTSKDLCLLTIEGLERSPVQPEPLTLAKKDTSPGDFVAVIGYPVHGLTTTVGQTQAVTAIEMPYPPNLCDSFDAFLYMAMGAGCVKPIPGIFHSASVQPGQSGGALVNSSGEVVGVVFGLEGSTGMSVQLSALKEFLEKGPTP